MLFVLYLTTCHIMEKHVLLCWLHLNPLLLKTLNQRCLLIFQSFVFSLEFLYVINSLLELFLDRFMLILGVSKLSIPVFSPFPQLPLTLFLLLRLLTRIICKFILVFCHFLLITFNILHKPLILLFKLIKFNLSSWYNYLIFLTNLLSCCL
jgi:hypothetical protein